MSTETKPVEVTLDYTREPEPTSTSTPTPTAKERAVAETRERKDQERAIDEAIIARARPMYLEQYMSILAISKALGVPAKRLNWIMVNAGISLRPRGPRPRLTPAQIISILERYGAGETVDALAREHRVSPTHVSNLLKRNGIVIRRGAKARAK